MVPGAKGAAEVQTPQGSTRPGPGDRASEGPAADPVPSGLVTASVPPPRLAVLRSGNRKQEAPGGCWATAPPTRPRGW